MSIISQTQDFFKKIVSGANNYSSPLANIRRPQIAAQQMMNRPRLAPSVTNNQLIKPYQVQAIQRQAVSGFGKLQSFGNTFAQKSGQFATNQIAKQPFALSPRDYVARKLAPIAAELPGRFLEGWGYAGGKLSTPTKTIQEFKKAPLATLESFTDYNKPSKASLAFNLAMPGLDVSDVSKYGLLGLFGAGMFNSQVEAKALKPFLPQIINVSKMLGNMDEIPELTMLQLKAAESTVAKIRGEDAIKQLRKLNLRTSDYYNSLRIILSGAKEQILNPEIRIGFTTKNIKTPRANNVSQAGLYDTKPVTLYHGSNKSLTKEGLDYGTFLTANKQEAIDYANMRSGGRGGKPVISEFALKPDEVRLNSGTGEYQYIGKTKNLSGGKYPEEIYKAVNDVEGSNLTRKEIDAMTPEQVRNTASMGFEGGRDQFDKLVGNVAQQPINDVRPKVTLDQVAQEAKEYPSANNFAFIANRKYGMSVEQATEIWNKAKQPMSVPTKGVVPEVLQTGKTQLQPPVVQTKALGVEPQVPGKVVSGEASSSQSIIPQRDKYAFNINKPRLGLTGESAKKLDDVVEQMRPVLEKRKGAPLTNKQIITEGRKGVMLDSVMSRQESAEFSSALQASRNFLKSESSKKGLTPEFLAQIEIVSSHASDKGRSLRAFAVDAEDIGIKETVVRDLQKLGIKTQRLIEASKNVDWDNAQQVTEFYRKFKPASILEMLEEYRYTNMLSSPLTQIVNIFSNFLQGGIVTPIEKTLTGTLDFARSRLTGTEQKYFAGQGVDFAKAYWKALPEGWSKFKSIVMGQGGLRKPDVDFIPTGTGKLHKIYTTPLRALEATDQLFRSMVIGGETASLKRVGIEGAEALKKAEAEATYRTFRQAFDPDGKLGQGDLLKLWDGWNVGINQLRHRPGGKWIVPFLQTPTNILKQGVEYSPLGFSTIKGSKEPMVQLSKAVLGTGVFTTAYALADSGLTTWDAPTNKNDREAFYEAGLQPYSIKIGDKWVSYSKLGPTSYPIAMAAAMKWAKDNGADDGILKTAGKGMIGFLQFFADQSYMQGIGDVIDAVRGDEYKQGRSLANIPSQLIPYRALQGWIARLIDPIYRKTSGGGILEQAGKSIISQTPFASKTLEPYTNSKGEESKRYAPLLNAFSPLRTAQQLTPYQPVSARGIYGELNRLSTPEEKAAKWQELVKAGRITKSNVKDIKGFIEDGQLGTTDREIDIRSDTVKDGDRARSIKREFDKLKTPQEKADLWKRYVELKIITPEVGKQLKALLN